MMVYVEDILVSADLGDYAIMDDRLSDVRDLINKLIGSGHGAASS
jgi:hypothetical protein